MTSIGTTSCPQPVTQTEDGITYCNLRADVFEETVEGGDRTFRCVCTVGHEQWFGESYLHLVELS